MKDSAIVTVFMGDSLKCTDLELPLDITANDLIIAFSTLFSKPIKREQIFNYCIRSDAPKALLMGENLLKDYGIRDGSKLWLWK